MSFLITYKVILPTILISNLIKSSFEQNLISSDKCRSTITNNIYPNCTFDMEGVSTSNCLMEGVMEHGWKEKYPNNKKIIFCSAPYPIDIILTLRDTHQTILFEFNYPEYVRTVGNISQKSTYLYKIRIPYGFTYSEQTYVKSIVIRNIANPLFSTTFIKSVFTSQRISEIEASAKNESIIIVTDELVKLPCVTLNGKFPEGVYKYDSENDNQNHTNISNIPVDNKTLLWDPYNGFTLNISSWPLKNYEGKYYCKSYTGLKNVKYSIILSKNITLKKLTETLVKPDLKDIKIFTISRTDINLKCTSVHEIILNGTLNNIPISFIDMNITQFQKIGGEENKIYNIIHHSINLKVGDEGIISCTRFDKNLPLFTWNLKVIDVTISSRQQALWVDRNGKKARCLGSFQRDITFKNIACRNPMECNIVKDCIRDDVSCSNIVQTGGSCNQLGCKQLNPFPHGILYCFTNYDNTIPYSVMYFTGFDGVLYSDWRDAPTSALVKLEIPNENSLYSKFKFLFSCIIHRVFTGGLVQWMIEFKNKTLIHIKLEELIDSKYLDLNESDSGLEDKGIKYDQSIYLETSEIWKIICLVPVWNSDEWINISRNLNIKESIPPKFKTKGKNHFFKIGSKDQSLYCEVESYPISTVIWSKEGNNDTKNYTILHNSNSATLIFPEFSISLTGNYICTATNVAGILKEIFKVNIDTGNDLDWLYVLLGVLVILVGIGLFVIFWIRKRLQENAEISDHLTDADIDKFLNGFEAIATQQNSCDSTNPDKFPYNDSYEIPIDKLTLEHNHILGSGEYGMVLRGRLEGRPGTVAIKTVKPNCNSDYFRSLLSELKVLMFIGKHTNIVELIGAYTQEIRDGVFYIISEECPSGNLENFLRTKHNQLCQNMRYANLNTPGYKAQQEEAILKDLNKWSYQIANAMEYIASKKVIHADLAARNVLLSKEQNAKLTDFGLSRKLYNYIEYVKTKQEPLPWRWMAIESLRELTFSTKSDVWSFGVLLWEMFSLAAIPYGGIVWEPVFVKKLKDNLRLPKPEIAPDLTYDLMFECWNNEPNDRPTFTRLKTYFLEYKASTFTTQV